MEFPLVSVVCLCYNHKPYVEEAIQSVLDQSYPNIQLVVVDDASTDGSQELIKGILKDHEEIESLLLAENYGNCKAFNLGLARCKGQFVIDFAADDVLLPNRIAKGVELLTEKGADYGVQFGDAILINNRGEKIGMHSDRFPPNLVPSGDIYIEIIQQYFICAPSMLIRKAVLEQLNGFDEELAYEDFDFLIRASRQFKFCYLSDAVVKRRMLPHSMSGNQFKRGSSQLRSTFVVCTKILSLNRSKAEHKALIKRVEYEMKVSLKLLDFTLLLKYYQLRRRVMALL